MSNADASWEGENAGDISGISLAGTTMAGAGDIDGDGYADLLIGSGFIGDCHLFPSTFTSTRLLTVKNSTGATKMVVTEAGDIELGKEASGVGGEMFKERPYPRALE